MSHRCRWNPESPRRRYAFPDRNGCRYGFRSAHRAGREAGRTRRRCARRCRRCRGQRRWWCHRQRHERRQGHRLCRIRRRPSVGGKFLDGLEILVVRDFGSVKSEDAHRHSRDQEAHEKHGKGFLHVSSLNVMNARLFSERRGKRLFTWLTVGLYHSPEKNSRAMTQEIVLNLLQIIQNGVKMTDFVRPSSWWRASVPS